MPMINRTMILHWPFDINSQIKSRSQCKIRISQKLSSRKNHVGISGLQNLLISNTYKGTYLTRLLSIRDQTYCSNEEIWHRLLHRRGERDLESGSTGDFLVFVVSTGTDV